MQQIKGNIWDFHGSNSYIGVTTNGVIRSNGSLIMGKGIALEARERFKGVDKLLGTLVKNQGNNVYLLASHGIFSFPTKDHFKDVSPLELIERSCQQLREAMNKVPNKQFYLIPPGCGLGGRDWDTEVEPVMLKYFKEENRLTIVEFSVLYVLK